MYNKGFVIEYKKRSTQLKFAATAIYKPPHFVGTNKYYCNIYCTVKYTNILNITITDFNEYQYLLYDQISQNLYSYNLRFQKFIVA